MSLNISDVIKKLEVLYPKHLAYDKDPIDTASYVILKEKQNNMGFDLEEILVKFDREKMIYSILSSGSPDETIKKFTCMRR